MPLVQNKQWTSGPPCGHLYTTWTVCRGLQNSCPGPLGMAKTVAKCLTGPCCRELNRTLQISHAVQTAQSPSTWLTRLKKTTRITFFFFCNKLKALFTNSINCHTVRIYGEILNYIPSCEGWKILLILMVRLIHKFNTFFQTQLLWKNEN